MTRPTPESPRVGMVAGDTVRAARIGQITIYLS